jgi:hypothetical protein
MTDASQYDGHGVYLRHRSYLYVLAIVRPAYADAVKPTTSLGTNKLLAGGVATTTALGAGGVAVTHSTTTPVKAKTSFSAPPFKASDFKTGSKSADVLVVEQALFKAGLLPKAYENSGWGNTQITALKAFQKANKLVSDGVINQIAYDALIKELP